ncbi:MAG: riboflavin synthase subunit alpha [Sphingobacteriia bacterium 35-40-5]|nr:MAG: riboflavin synthase subunit alpha [Sphingobacteriia bacterium 35-40-5]
MVAVTEGTHTVTAISETLNKSNLGKLKEGDLLNLERCMQMNGRLDGHIVQGHVDQTGICTEVIEKNGSWEYTISYDPAIGNITVEKGSICVNGISLTVINSKENSFSVAIIPYTYEHTNMKSLKIGDTVNLEFDIIGKYVARLTRQKI